MIIHPTMSKDELDKEILKEIRKNHKLEKCPACAMVQ